MKANFLCFFYVSFFFHMYIAPGRGRQPIGDKNLWQQKGLFSLPICCKFQNDVFEIWFIHIFNDLALIGPAVFEKKIFENGGRRTDGRQRTDDDGPWLYYKLTNEPRGSGELKMMKKQLYPSDSSTFCNCTEEIPPTVWL